MPIKIEYAIIDVRGARAKLRKRVANAERVSFSISGYFDQAMNDDGTSQEYAAIVTDYAVDGEHT